MPIIVVLAPTVEVSRESIVEMDAQYRNLWARGERYAIITHTAAGTDPAGPIQRKLIADWARRPDVKANAAKYCVASATLATSRVIRGTMTALLWLWRPPMPHRVTATPTAAVDYCLDALAEANVPLRMSERDTRRLTMSALY